MLLCALFSVFFVNDCAKTPICLLVFERFVLRDSRNALPYKRENILLNDLFIIAESIFPEYVQGRMDRKKASIYRDRYTG